MSPPHEEKLRWVEWEPQDPEWVARASADIKKARVKQNERDQLRKQGMLNDLFEWKGVGKARLSDHD